MTLKTVILFFCLLLSLPAIHADEEAVTITREALEAIPPGNWIFSANLITRVGKTDDGEPSSAGEIRDGEIKLAIEFTQQRNGNRKIIFRSQDDPLDGIQVAYPPDFGPGVRFLDLKTRKPATRLTSGFHESLLSIDDLSLRYLTWPDQELMGQAKVKDRPCWKITCRPPKGDPTPYHHVEVWIDRGYRAFLKAVAYNERDEVLKELHVRSFQEIGETWMLKRLEARHPSSKSRTRLEILEGERVE